MKRLLSFLITLILVVGLTAASSKADEAAVKVKNYKELLSAVNEEHATKILISSKYKQSKVHDWLYLDGTNLTLAPDGDEPVVMTGSVYICGPGSVVFDRISIQGGQDELGLYVK